MDGELRRRWNTPEGVLLAGEVLARLQGGLPLDGLGLGDVGGRVDLRGFPAPQSRPVSGEDVAGFRAGTLPFEALAGKAELVRLNDVTLRGLDLSGAVLDQVTIQDSVIEDCVLDEIRGHDLGIARSRVRDTSFRGADLLEEPVSYGAGWSGAGSAGSWPSQ